VASAATTPAARATQVSRDQTLARFFAPTTPPLVSYRARRHLSAETRGGRTSASLDAMTALDPVAGFSFQVVSEDGSGIIRHRVLLAALEAEQKAVRGDESRQAALTPDNYDFLTASQATDSLVKVDIRARRRQMMLIDGALFLEPDNAQLVRLEGNLSARPSFWTRKVRVVREYAEIAGVHVPVAMRSTADVLIVGASTFEMTYQYEEINGRAIRGQSR
jgi:hypothetical protein